MLIKSAVQTIGFYSAGHHTIFYERLLIKRVNVLSSTIFKMPVPRSTLWSKESFLPSVFKKIINWARPKYVCTKLD